MTYDAIIFDLDGTLIDTSGPIIAALREMERRYGIAPLPLATLREFIGPPLIEKTLEHYHVTEEKGWEMIGCYRDIYMAEGAPQGEVYDGIPELLAELRRRGVGLGVATLKAGYMAELALGVCGLLDSFDVISAYDDKNPRSKAELIMDAARGLGVDDPARVLMIGDSIYDGEGAKEAGVDFVPVTYGLGFSLGGVPDALPRVVCAKDVPALGRFILGA